MLEDRSATELQPVQLGKRIELRHIPFSELAIPWNVVVDNVTLRRENNRAEEISESKFDKVKANGAKVSRKIRNADIVALKNSIAKFGLLRPFSVAEIQEEFRFFYGKGKYFIFEGQLRYLALQCLLKLESEEDDKRQKGNLKAKADSERFRNLETQAQKHLERLSLIDYVLVPCIVYPYSTFLQMARHSIEDKRFCEKPPKGDYDLLERMSLQGTEDLQPDDLRGLWKTRALLEEERESIERTLEEIRIRLKQKDLTERAENLGHVV